MIIINLAIAEIADHTEYDVQYSYSRPHAHRFSFNNKNAAYLLKHIQVIRL